MLRSRLINITILIVGIFLIVNLTRSIWQLLRAGERIEKAQEQVVQLRLKNDELKKKLAEVQSPFFLEKVARDKLGLAKEGEVVVILPPYQPPPNRQAEENLPNWQKWLKLFF